MLTKGIGGVPVVLGNFSPLDISGLQLWLDGSDPETLFQDAAKTTPAINEDDPVGAWVDKSGVENTVTQGTSANRPILKLNAKDNLSGLRFDGSNDRLTKTLAGPGFVPPFYIFVVAKLNAAGIGDTVSHGLVGSNDATNLLIIDKTNETPDRFRSYGNGASSGHLRSVPPDANWHVFSRFVDGANGGFWIDGNLVASGNGGTPSLTSFAVGTANTVGYWFGDIGEVIVCGPAVDKNQVEQYLVDRWAITCSYGPNQTTDTQQTLPQNMPNAPAVLLTFDDGYMNNYTVAYPVLEARNIQATIYMIASWINGGSGSYLTTSQLLELDEAGWDIGNHTSNHPNLTTLSEADQETQFINCKATLDSLGLTRASSHVAYPFGAYNADTLIAMADAEMLTGRAYSQGVKRYLTDMSSTSWYEIMVVEVTYTTSLEEVKGLVSWGACHGYITVLVFHQIIDSGTPVANQWLSSDLAALADWINDQKLPTLTISQLHSLRSGELVYSNPWS